ncbi:Tubby-like F-box protein 1 [Raphanus sativus]|uniref:Tubby-like F-box protein n=1 Tax=Raphanus sativus TaxID=3726 RepID=A0A6J0KFR2_RAPSA|nr:tubby-like F-box protein 1 [Raphanus sativus]XP_056846973.1 tubby-like F-box protein 1 [Raphanus sativus]XP_056846974.1 tubby-like F-box protein 1 [Raphanus sativus]XP_056846975.1 tubby-like F-box protein 1 [Raphanus sativus]XP_056846976.1 tubby-like F-box protein 1 [Raphanus sativus]KAJ4883960.1 Tubby-like F-box protein 1 [Raphanus sativus]
MSFRSIVRDVRDSIGSLSRRSFDFKLSSLNKEGVGKSRGSVQDCHEEQQQQQQPPLALPLVQETPWANLPPELLRDVIKRLEESESVWPARKHVVACASVCRSWRDMCKEIVQRPELSGKITFPVSLKQPGPRDATMQCFIKRDKSNLTYHLYLCLSPALLVENGKFLLSAKRIRRTTYTEYVISMHADTISRSSNTYIGKIRSNFLGTKFIIYDTQPPYNNNKTSQTVQPLGLSRRFYSKRVSPKVPTGSYKIAQVSYELNVLGTRGPRRMHCAMDSIPASSLAEGGTVPGQPEAIVPRSILDESFRSITSSSSSSRKFISDYSAEFNSARFSDILGPLGEEEEAVFGEGKERVSPPLVLKNKPPRWHEQLQCWCLNFRGRVTVASVKNFQLIAANQPQAQVQGSGQADGPDKILLQFGKVGKDMFTMDFRYPLSAFQAFAICLSSFDTKLACE